MMFDDAIEQALATSKEAEVKIVRLGEVTAVTGGRPTIKHYGDSNASIKQYTCIDGYFPEVGDKVAMLPQANTYIILGKVINAAAVQVWAYKDHNHDTVYLKLEYKNKLEDSNEDTITLSGNALLPKTDNTDDLGSSSKYFKNAYIKKLILNGTEYTEFKQDRIEVKSGGSTYSLIATYSSGYITLTPSSNDRWKLGTKSYQFNEAWLGDFRGAWKSGQTTERSVSWNSSNALIPDTNNSVDLGSSSYGFKQLFLNALVGAKYQYQSNSANNIAWNSATELAPNNTNVVNLGSSTKQFNNIYAKEFYINGTKLDIDGITLDKLTTKYSNTSYTLTLSVKSPGASSQYEELTPSHNNKFVLGNTSYKFQNMYSTKFTGDLEGAILNGTYSVDFDSSHNWIPSSTNTLSLGTSQRQFLNVYGQNLYVNGTAVTSDRRKKEEIAPLDERYEEFFKELKPVSFKMKDGTSGRRHTGFIAQDVEQAAEEAGLTDKDIAVVVKDPEDNYYLRYEEIIAVQTDMIQKLMAKVDALEARVYKLEEERSKA